MVMSHWAVNNKKVILEGDIPLADSERGGVRAQPTGDGMTVAQDLAKARLPAEDPNAGP